MVAKNKNEDFSIDTNDKDLMALVNCITNPFNELNSSNKFKVFTLEASRGKTQGSIHSIIVDIKTNGAFGKRILFVSKFKDECIDFVTKVNKNTNESFAVAYMPSATKEDEEKNSNITSNFSKCITKKIVAMTHEMFLRLCIGSTDKYQIMKFQLEKNFNTLIVDEQIDNVNSTYATFNITVYEQVLNIFKTHSEVKSTYKKICEPLLNLIDNNAFNDTQIHRTKYTGKLDGIDFIAEKECETINAFIEESIIDESLEDYGIDSSYITTKSDLKKFISDIALFYNELENDNVLINSEFKTLFTYYSEFEFIKLHNNIWLDASAKFNSMYTLNKEFFDVVDSERIIDHSNCNLYYHRENTSKSYKDRNNITEFRKKKIEFITKHSKKNSKVLILTSKTEGIQLKKKHLTDKFMDKLEEYEILNFDNMRGVNTCRDYNYCYIIQTPRRQIPYYIFLYEYWKGEKLTDKEMETNKIDGNEDWGFNHHKELQQLLTDDIASSLYQGCKRIARSQEPIGYFHIFCKVNKAIEIVQEQFYRINSNKDGKLTDYNNSKRKKNSYPNKFIKLLKILDEGTHKKKDICIKMGMKDSKHFSDKVFIDDAKEFVNNHKDNVNIRGQDIIITKKLPSNCN